MDRYENDEEELNDWIEELEKGDESQTVDQKSHEREVFERVYTNGKRYRPRRKNSIKSILAFAFSFFGQTALLGLIIALIDLVCALFGMIFVKNRSRKRHFFSFLSLVVLVIMVLTSFNPIKKISLWWNRSDDPNFETHYDPRVEESMKNTPSDIEGMSIYDKAQAGLDIDAGSDTDGDGITDKDEIEKYELDPLKVSTSGDPIPDSVKIELGLNAKKKYRLDEIDLSGSDYENIFSHPDNISIDKTKAENAFADIGEHSVVVDGEEAAAGYLLRNVEGEVTVDFSDKIESGKDYVAYKIDNQAGGKTEQIPIKDNKVYCKCTFGSNSVGLYEKKDSSINKSILFIPSGVIGVLSDILLTRSMDTRFIYMFELSNGEDNDGGRGDEVSALLSDGLGEKIQVYHEYVDILQYYRIKSILKSVCGDNEGYVLYEDSWGMPYWWAFCYSEIEDSSKYSYLSGYVVKCMHVTCADPKKDVKYPDSFINLYKGIKPFQGEITEKCESDKFCVIHDGWSVMNADICYGMSDLAVHRYNTRFGDEPYMPQEYADEDLAFFDFKNSKDDRYKCLIDDDTRKYLLNYDPKFPLSELLNPHINSYGVVPQYERDKTSEFARNLEYDQPNIDEEDVFLSKEQYDKCKSEYPKRLKNNQKLSEENIEFMENNQQLLAYISNKQHDQPDSHMRSYVGEDTIRAIKDYFQSGRVFILNVYSKKWKFFPVVYKIDAHSVVAYDIEQSSNDEDVYYMYVYEPNYPADIDRDDWDGQVIKEGEVDKYRDRFKVVLNKRLFFSEYKLEYDPKEDCEFDLVGPISTTDGRPIEEWSNAD